MQIGRIRLLAVLLLLCAVPGCATGGAAGDAISVQLQVNNDLSGITGVVVHLVTEAGIRRTLGPVESNRVGEFQRNLRLGDYAFIATRVGGPDIVSERFRVDDPNVVVTWNIQSNQLTFTRR